LLEHNIEIYFYCLHENYQQVDDFINLERIKVMTIDACPVDTKVYDLWIGSNEHSYNWFVAINEPLIGYDTFFCKYYNKILMDMNINVQIEKFIYHDDDLRARCEDINKRTNNKYIGLDFLVINGTPRSGQFDYNQTEFDAFVLKLSAKFRVVTTQKVQGIMCTRDDNLTAKDIASVALNIKGFIAIESGVIAGLYNGHLVSNRDVVVYSLSKYEYHACSFENFHCMRNLDELSFLL